MPEEVCTAITLDPRSPGHSVRLQWGDFVYEWPFHDHEHLQQILDILKQRYLPLMTETMRVALVGQ